MKYYPVIFKCICSRMVLAVMMTLSWGSQVTGQSSADYQSDLRYLQNIVHTRYSNLFYTTNSADWDKAAEEFYKRIPGMNAHQVLTGFVKLIALFHVGHTQMNTRTFHGGTGDLQLRKLPYRLYWFSDGLYVIMADEKYESAIGGKVTHIGKLKVKDAAEAIRPLVSYENESGFLSNSVHFLAIPEYLKAQGIAESDQEVTLRFIKNGKEQSILFKATTNNVIFGLTGLEVPQGWKDARKNDQVPLWRKEPASFRYQEFLPNQKTLYVRHSVTLSDGDKPIQSFFENVTDYIDKNDVQRLILDVRMNGGGNNYLNKPIIKSIIESKKINEKGKFYCIIGRRTFSAAQNLVNEIEKYTEVTFVGEPTSENVNFYGDTRTEILPITKWQVNLSWLWWQNLDPRDKRLATYPAIAAEMSFDDYYNNEDPVIQSIFASFNERPFLPTLVDKIKSDRSAAYTLAVNYKNDPKNRYSTELENSINTEGYKLMEAQDMETASALLELNFKLFPESANACDSYAESLTYLNRNEEAVKYYEMAIVKDKEGRIAENARQMIAKIKSQK